MMEEIKLINYLPPILRRVEELMALCSSEDPEFEQARRAFMAVCVNLFVTTATEDGIYRFEKELGITADALDTLEMRKARIIALKMGSSVYTMRWLRLWLKSVGATAEPILTDHTLKVVLPSKSDYRSLFNALIAFIPAHIRLIEGVVLSSSEMRLYTGTAVRFSTKRTVEGNSSVLTALLADEDGTLLSDEDGNYLIE